LEISAIWKFRNNINNSKKSQKFRDSPLWQLCLSRTTVFRKSMYSALRPCFSMQETNCWTIESVTELHSSAFPLNIAVMVDASWILWIFDKNIFKSWCKIRWFSGLFWQKWIKNMCANRWISWIRTSSSLQSREIFKNSITSLCASKFRSKRCWDSCSPSEFFWMHDSIHRIRISCN